MQDDLELLRERINTLDEEILRLLNDRAATALQIGKIKLKDGKPAYDPERERTVIDRVNNLNNGPLNKGAIEEIYACIITACRELQIPTVDDMRL